MADRQKVLSLRVVAQVVLFIVVLPLLPLLISWRWDWWEAWVYGITAVLGFVVSRVLAARRHPDVIAERARFLQQEDVEPWDRLLVPLVALGAGLIVVVAGLDARLRWSPAFSLPLKLLSLAILLAGYALASYALIENRFFSATVRIQLDRGHQVVSSGPYRWVRHPGYAGGLLTYLATPLLLDAPWALIPAGFTVIVVVIRTALEDRTLQDWLEGYRDYARRVRYRLLPGVW